MGFLHYDGEEFDFDDRVLLHLQIVISTKLRRHENFFITWALPMERGSGRRAIWVDNGVPIHFSYSGLRAASINRDWVEILMASANSGSGLIFTTEPVGPGASQPKPAG